MYNSREVSLRTRQRRIRAMRIVCGTVAVALWSAAPVMGIASQVEGSHTKICFADQPLYTATAPFVRTGTWVYWLADGKSVTLPDGDTATCVSGELFVH